MPRLYGYDGNWGENFITLVIKDVNIVHRGVR